MDSLDPLSQVAGGNAPSPLLLFMGCIGAFFAGFKACDDVAITNS